MNNVKIETINFPQLLDKAQLIKIPLLQRDYAQGRKKPGVTTIRKDFLSNIFKHLQSRDELRLDFIYGTIENKCFVPLDGQQRLTTLFLLYWYCAMAKNEIENFQNRCVDEYGKSKFCYTTRTSATDFCNALVNSKNMSAIDITGKKLSSKIENSTWYYSAWRHDPTVAGMLVMLDAIHDTYKKGTQNWEYGKLDTIQFEFIDLEEFKLTDDLYIKMNARGKQLTSFEIFKAKFEQCIQDSDPGWEKNISTAEEYTTKFAYKIDNEWVDLFWSIYSQNGFRNQIDEKGDIAHSRVDLPLLRLFSFSAMVRTAKNKDKEGKWKEIIQDIQADASCEKLSAEKYFTNKDDYDYICCLLNTYHQYKDKIINLYQKDEFPFFNYHIDTREPGHASLLCFITNPSKEPSYSQKILFFAESEYLRRTNPKDFDSQYFSEWMRVVRNIISRGNFKRTSMTETIRDDERFGNAIQVVTTLAEGCHDIYQLLSNEDNKNDKLPLKNQIDHEFEKAQLIKKEKDKGIIFDAEDRKFCHGNISFVLECARGINDEHNINNIQNISDTIGRYIDDIWYGNQDINKEQQELFRRALLATPIKSNGKDKYEYYSTHWSSWTYLFDMKKHSLIHKSIELEYFVYRLYPDESREYLKQLILKLAEVNGLKDIINNIKTRPEGMHGWQFKLIKKEELLGDRVYIACDDKKCYILYSERPQDENRCTEVKSAD